MPMSTIERARIAARASAAAKTPEQRKAHSRKAYLAGAVNAIVSRAPELTTEQTERLRAIFATAEVA